MEKRAVIILNPVSGKMKGKAKLFETAEILSGLFDETLLYITKKRGDATFAAAKYRNNCDTIVVVGGDGTLNEVISGLVGQKDGGITPKLCYLPAGSTNDFAAALGIPKEIDSAEKAIRVGNLFSVDIGRMEELYFTYIASFGLFTRASYAADQSVKNVLGHFAYVLEGAKEIGDLGKAYHVRVTVGETVQEGDYIFGSVSNTTMMGGIFPLPESRVSFNDGLFEVMLVRAPKNLDDIAKDYSMMKNGNFDGENIVFLQGNSVRIESSEEIAWCTDGEFAGDRKEVHIEILPRAVSLYIK